jgi:hypothetical protein
MVVAQTDEVVVKCLGDHVVVVGVKRKLPQQGRV